MSSPSDEHPKGGPGEALPPPAPEKSPGPEKPPDTGPAAAEEEVKGPGRKPRKHEHETIKSLKEKLENREAEIEAAKKAAADFRDKFLRAAAEMDNQRKRLEREKEDFFQYALSGLLLELLGVLDNFERAVSAREAGDAQHFQAGVDLILKQLQDVLRRQGVVSLEMSDRRFDPAQHQAIMTEEAEGITEPVVGEILQKGYRLHDRLLRAAMVKVHMPKKG